ncbi:MAG TPA: DsbE family thiol:disulfide interchange protein [Phenylobacterium sp.]|uniref:DsbE family thiol:disulfide interchange protein n=1 Tax=Phenylobacterium sp. TaxID=1871053 RepID=UPI002B48FDA2|nr:DsbE family thiol:disulfide interchange protein [Phenylobacterium sp.]HKR89054.1 DsbE family thiol:disulfide interchange protein [Phenylobacterium sp.]
MSRWLTILPLVVLAALAALFGLYGLHHDPKVQPHAMVGKPMPDLALPALEDGRPARLRELTASGPVVVNFFASWCAPCEVEAPQLNALSVKGVRIVGVAYKDKPPKTQAFLARLGDPYVARLSDLDGRAGVEFGVTGVPETYLIGRDGTILSKHTGPLEADDVKALAQQAR